MNPHPHPVPSPRKRTLCHAATAACPTSTGRAGAMETGWDSLPDHIRERILQRAFADMGSALLPWLRMSLVCWCAAECCVSRKPVIRCGAGQPEREMPRSAAVEPSCRQQRQA